MACAVAVATVDTGARAAIQRAALYGLAVASTWSIAGIEAMALLLVPLGLFELWLARRRGEPVPLPAAMVAPVAAFLAAALLSALANEDRGANLMELRGYYRVLLPLALLPVIPRVDRRRWLLLLSCGVILSALYGMVQFFDGVDWLRSDGRKLVTPSTIRGSGAYHAMGSFSHHLTFAGAMLVHLVFFLALFLDEPRRVRWLWLGTSLAAAVGMACSMGRSAWVGAVVGMAVLLLRLPRRIGMPLLAAGAVAAAALCTALWSGSLARSYDAAGRPVLVRRLLSTSFDHDKDRVYLWEAGLLGFRAHPIVGIGTGNDRTDFAQWRHLVAARHGGYRFLTTPEAGVHNVFLQIAYETGVIGLAAYLSWMGGMLVWCRRGIARSQRRPSLERGILFGCAAALLASMTAGLFENNFLDAEVQIQLLLHFALALDAGLVLQGARRDLPAGGVPAASRAAPATA